MNNTALNPQHLSGVHAIFPTEEAKRLEKLQKRSTSFALKFTALVRLQVILIFFIILISIQSTFV